MYYPWANTPMDLEHRLGATSKGGKPGRKGKIPPELWPVLRSLEPYGRGDGYSGGDDLVRELAKAGNRKHTIRLAFSVQVTGTHIDEITNRSGGSISFFVFPQWNPVKNELVVAEVSPELTVDYRYELTNPHIAIDEAPPLKGIPVIEALRHFLANAQTVLERLELEVVGIIGK